MQVTYLWQQGPSCFLLFWLFSTPPAPPSRIPSLLTALRSFDNLQPICACFEGTSGKTPGLSVCPAKLSVLQVGGWEFIDTGGLSLWKHSVILIFATDEMQPPYMQCFTRVSNYLTAPILSAHATACRRRRKQVICIQSKYFVITCCSS